MWSWLTWWWRFFTRIAVWPRDLPVLVRAMRKRKRWSPPAEVWAKVDAVTGFMGLRECGLLYRAGKHWPVTGPVIELGSYKGRSTTVWALAGRQVHAVDAWTTDNYAPAAIKEYFVPDESALTAFRANIARAGVAERITVHRGLTTEMAQGWQTPAAILFIDAGHHYPAVRGDLDAWLPHLAPDGLLLLHDTFSDQFAGVIQAAGELLKDGWVIVASAGTIVGLARPATARQVGPEHFGEA